MLCEWCQCYPCECKERSKAQRDALHGKSQSAGSVANDAFLKDVIKLNNWFIAHQLSAYKKADQETRDHLDRLYLEFNRRWKLLLCENKLEDLPPQNKMVSGAGK